MMPPRLSVRHVLLACLVGSLPLFPVGPAEAGPPDKVRGKRSVEAGSLDKIKGKSREKERPSDGRSQPDPQQQANLQELRDSLGALAGGAAAAEDEIRNLAQDLQGMALQPPDPALTQALAADLAEAMSDASLSPKEIAQLTQAVHALMNSAGLSQAEVETLKDDVEAILTASGVDRSDVQAVLDDLQAIYDASQGQRSGEKRRRTGRRGNP